MRFVLGAPGKIMCLGLNCKDGRVAATDVAPTPFRTPAFGLRLGDAKIADVVTFIRSAWGNRGAQVEGNRVTRLHRELRAKPGPADAR